MASNLAKSVIGGKWHLEAKMAGRIQRIKIKLGNDLRDVLSA